MPLPPALLARLSKRGIVEAEQPLKKENKSDEVEEVFAEDYDDPSKPEVPEEKEPPPVIEPQPVPLQKLADIEPIYRETTACPSRSNPYHICVPYCRKRYGMREWKPESVMLKKRQRMLSKYPLPEGWIEVGDHDTCRYYYWNTITDEVSWLSPTHPKVEISKSAEQLGLIGKIGNLDSDGEQAMEEEPDDNMSEKSGSDTSLSDEEEVEEKKTKLVTESRLFKMPLLQNNINKQDTRKSRVKAEELDPMDPAAYSDIARGGWSDGLDTRGKAKTGVDETASGPLFQQRPYPSPGAILRANQSLKKKK